MVVSPVRKRLQEDRLGPSRGVPEPADSRDVRRELRRVEAMAWVWGRLAWEDRLAALRERATVDHSLASERARTVPLAG